MKKKILFMLTCFFLAGCSSDLVSKRYRPDFQNTIANSNKRVLILEPIVTSYKINDAKKENYEASRYLTNVVRDAAIAALGKKGYKAIIFSNKEFNDSETISLKNEIEKKSNIYIQKKYFTEGLVSSKEAIKLDDNFGESAIKLGSILNTNLIVGIQYTSSFESDNSGQSLNGLLFKAIDSVTGSGITKREVYICHLVLVDALTGNVIFSDGLYNTNSGLISVSEKDLFAPKYIEQVTNLIEQILP